MRHKKKFNHLGRKRGHRKAMLSNMASSLIVHKRIKTTIAKAKALKMFVEPLITKAKEDTTHSRRHVFSNLQDKEATNELFREVAAKVGERPGGYTRIIKLGKRLGDNADMCIIELVDFNENMLAEKAATKTSRRRRGGSKKKEDAETVDTAAPEVAVAEEVKTEEVAEEVKAEAEVVEEVKEEKAEEEKKEDSTEEKKKEE
jgi:large subunit ribosomal protein L17